MLVDLFVRRGLDDADSALVAQEAGFDKVITLAKQDEIPNRDFILRYGVAGDDREQQGGQGENQGANWLVAHEGTLAQSHPWSLAGLSGCSRNPGRHATWSG